MELKSIYDNCMEKADTLAKIKNYFDRGDIPQVGSPYKIDNPEIFFTVISLETVQAKAPEFEKYVGLKTRWIKIPAKENRGDYFDPINNKYIELKASFTNKDKCLNMRQIRLWQEVDYYLAIYIDHNNLLNSKVYLLTHMQMSEEVEKRGSATHGTGLANQNNENIEYSITIPIGSSIQQEWDRLYFNAELFNLLFRR